jgi:hypothetical protein
MAALGDTHQVGANTVIQIDATDSVTLNNVTETALSANNFYSGLTESRGGWQEFGVV